jgi:hypothetical protein
MWHQLAVTLSHKHMPGQFVIALTRTENTNYLGVLISLWLFLFSYLQHTKRIFLRWVQKLEQRIHKCVELRVEYLE